MCHKDFANVALKSSPAPPASLEAYEANPSTKFNMMLRIVQHHFGHAGAAPLALAANDDDEPENPDEPNNVRPTDIAQIRGGLWTQGAPIAPPGSTEPPVDTRTPSAAAGKHDKIVIFSSFASHFDYMLAVSTNLSNVLYCLLTTSITAAQVLRLRPLVHERLAIVEDSRFDDPQIPHLDHVGNPIDFRCRHSRAQPRLCVHFDNHCKFTTAGYSFIGSILHPRMYCGLGKRTLS